MRVLILDTGNSGAYHVMRTVARAGHEAHLSSSEDAIWSRSKYCAKTHRSPPVAARSQFAAYLLELVTDVRFDLLVICGDSEAELVWSHRDGLERRVACVLPDDAVAPIAFSKNAAYRHAARIGVALPRTAVPRSLADLVAIHRTFAGQPMIVKGEHGSAGKRVRRVTTFDELVLAYREISAMDAPDGGQPSVQEYVDGPGFVVHALFERGRPLAICSHRKDREYPATGGVTASATTVHEPALDAAALRFLESLRWHGLAKLDFMHDTRDHVFKFIELDPRVSASIDITRAAGSEQILMLCALAAGKSVKPQLEYEAGVHYRWLFPRDVLSVLARPKQLLAFTHDFIRRKRHSDIALLDDPRVGYQAARKLCWYVRRDLRRRHQ